MRTRRLQKDQCRLTLVNISSGQVYRSFLDQVGKTCQKEMLVLRRANKLDYSHDGRLPVYQRSWRFRPLKVVMSRAVSRS